MAKHQINARIREQKGKEAAKKLRKNDKIPAVFYSTKSDPIMLTIEKSDLSSLLKDSTGENIIIELQIESEKGGKPNMVMLKELQTHPVKRSYIHADFFEIAMDREITINVPVVLINTPVGVTNGGILQHIRREITVSCLPGKMIESIELDVSGLDVGEALHISDVNFPEGITHAMEDHLAVAIVSAPDTSEGETETQETEGVTTEEQEKAAETEGEQE